MIKRFKWLDVLVIIIVLLLMLCACATTTEPVAPVPINLNLVLVIAALTLSVLITVMALFVFLPKAEEAKKQPNLEQPPKPSKPKKVTNTAYIRKTIEQSLRRYHLGQQAKLIREEDEYYVIIKLGPRKKLKLEVTDNGEFFVIKEKELPQTQAFVEVASEGMESKKLSESSRDFGLRVSYQPDSKWAFLDLVYESATEEGIIDDKLELFFDMGDYPPAPEAVKLEVEEKAKLERKGPDFYLVKKGVVKIVR